MLAANHPQPFWNILLQYALVILGGGKLGERSLHPHHSVYLGM